MQSNEANFADVLLTALLAIIDKRLERGESDFRAQELEQDTLRDTTLNNHPSTILRLALKPLLSPEIMRLLNNIFRDDTEAKKMLIEKLSHGLFAKAVRDYIIGVLAKGLKHQYAGPEEVLRAVLVNSHVSLRHEYTKVLSKSYQPALAILAAPSPSLQPTLKPMPRKNRPQDDN